MKFLRNVLATLVGLVIFFGILFFISIGLITMASSSATAPEVYIQDQSVLHLKLDKPIEERGSNNPLSNISLLGTDYGSLGLIELRNAIKSAADDEKIKGILMEPGTISAGYPSLEELRNELKAFKDSGKFIYSYDDYYSEKGYYLASVSNKIYLPSEGYMEFNGLSQNTTFFKNTLEKLEIEPVIFKVGDYKSATEPFTRESMSKASKEQTKSYLTSIFNNNLQNIGESRGIDTNRLKEVADSMKVRSGEDALKHALIDGLLYRDQMKDSLKNRVKVDSGQEVSYVDLSKYQRALDQKKLEKANNSSKIAVVVASGNIVQGESEQDVLGSKTFIEEIKKAREDDNIKAVVIRINSPGGSALASDLMWREIHLTSKEKPVIASMSDMAASGGYYLAMACDTILAQPNTLTGSIGIFGVFMNTEDFFENKLGITFDNVKTGEYADILNPTREMSETEKQIMQSQVERGYETFTKKAAQGRDMPYDSLLKVASGRVWSGLQAKKHNLVDKIGGLDDAVKIAAESSNTKNYSVRYLPEQKPFFQKLMEQLQKNMGATIWGSDLGKLKKYKDQLNEALRYQGVQARVPYEIKIQ